MADGDGKFDALLEQLDKLTLLEASQLIKRLEERWGVSAAAPMVAAMPAGGAATAVTEAAPPVEEQTEFDAILSDVGAQKIQVIKVVRELTGLGLKEAKSLVDEAPKPVKTGIPKEEAEAIKAKLAEVGAVVEIK